MRIIKPIAITPAMVTACNVPETDYPDWLISTAYIVGDTVLSNHHIYECLVNNTGYLPEDNLTGATPKWLYISYNNRWKMFDEIVGSQTQIADTLTVTVEPGLIDSVAFLDINATEIIIVMTDPIEGIVYEETIDLVSKSAIVDGYTYFFQPIITDEAVILLGIPPYVNAAISIEINNPSGTVKLGTLAFGMQKDLGFTQYDPTIGINDYSKKEVDAFGNYTILERAFSKRLSCTMFLDNTAVDSLVATLALYRASPVVWVAVDSGFSSMIIYGFYRSFSVNVKYVENSICSLELEGLT